MRSKRKKKEEEEGKNEEKGRRVQPLGNYKLKGHKGWRSKFTHHVQEPLHNHLIILTNKK